MLSNMNNDADLGPLIATLTSQDVSFFLDFDGTLADIAPTPDEVQFPDDRAQTIQTLFEVLEKRVAIVSGRDVTDLEKHIGTFPGYLSGGHGISLKTPDKRYENAVIDTALLKRLKSAVLIFCSENPAILLEDKVAGFSLHYRNSPDLETRIHDFAEDLLKNQSEFKIIRAKMAIEIKPAAYTKATALERLSTISPFESTTCVYIGDDVTDEDGFKFVNSKTGISIKIGNGPTCAKYRLHNPAHLFNMLDMFIAHKDQEKATPS